MQSMRKKSSDRAVNQMIVKAYKQEIDLAWDRSGAMQPQCGFARLALCCSECAAGPCRISPFSEAEQSTICGRDRHDLVAAALVRQVKEGTLALVQLASEFGAKLSVEQLLPALFGDNLVDLQSADSRLRELAACALAALTAVQQAVKQPAQRTRTQVNLGVLQTAGVNILVYGHVAPGELAQLAVAAAEQGAGLFTMAGNEVGGDLNLPIVTNYVSQEAPLLSGAVDLLVLGSQCVQPAVPKLAAELGIPCLVAGQLRSASEACAAVAAASAHFTQRAGRATNIPDVTAQLDTNFAADDCQRILTALAGNGASAAIKGLAYFGGCGHIAATQDADLIKQAARLMEQGYLLVTAGCAGTALAKAGLCDAEWHNFGTRALPKVLHVGSCHDAARFLAMAEQAADHRLPTLAVFAELVHHKILATAMAFAASGITVYADLEWAFADKEVEHLLANLAGSIRPLTAANVEVAASK